MSSQINELLQKINDDGIHAAQEQARQIEENAESKAQEIINKAKEEAKQIISKAKEEASHFQINAEKTLQQSSRNVVLEVRARIVDIFNRILANKADTLLTGKEFATILSAAVKGYTQSNGVISDIQMLLNTEDQKRLSEGLLGELSEELKKSIDIKRADELKAGFIISFNKESSCYDFSDEALVEFLAKSLNKKLALILTSDNSQKAGND